MSADTLLGVQLDDGTLEVVAVVGAVAGVLGLLVAFLALATIRHVAVVRYDAFGDLGGRLSFSAALLDDAGDGLVVTSINGRTETRNYAKIVRNLKSPHNLSEEELEAIGQAA